MTTGAFQEEEEKEERSVCPGEEGVPKEESCNHPWGNEGPNCSEVKRRHLTEVKTVTKSIMVLLH